MTEPLLTERHHKRRPFKRIDYLYKEYVRLQQRLDAVVDGSFADFKMLAALGNVASLVIGITALYAHQGSMNLSALDEQARVQLAFVGFLCILAIPVVVAFRDLLKMSLMAALIEHLSQYESELRKQLELETTHTFEMNLRADEWRKRQHGWVYLLFQFVFTLSISGIPAYVLFVLDPQDHYAWAYIIICTTAFMGLSASSGLLRRFRLKAVQAPAA
jgi:hypothetical protein